MYALRGTLSVAEYASQLSVELLLVVEPILILISIQTAVFERWCSRQNYTLRPSLLPVRSAGSLKRWSEAHKYPHTHT